MLSDLVNLLISSPGTVLHLRQGAHRKVLVAIKYFSFDFTTCDFISCLLLLTLLVRFRVRFNVVLHYFQVR